MEANYFIRFMCLYTYAHKTIRYDCKLDREMYSIFVCIDKVITFYSSIKTLKFIIHK